MSSAQCESTILAHRILPAGFRPSSYALSDCPPPFSRISALDNGGTTSGRSTRQMTSEYSPRALLRSMELRANFTGSPWRDDSWPHRSDEDGFATFTVLDRGVLGAGRSVGTATASRDTLGGGGGRYMVGLTHCRIDELGRNVL